MRHDGENSFLWVWVWVVANQRMTLSVLARKPHKRLAREISNETGRRREKSKVSSGQQKRGVSDSQGKATVRGRQLLKEELGLVDPEAWSASSRGWICVPGSCIGILFADTLGTATECQKSSQTSPFLR